MGICRISKLRYGLFYMETYRSKDGYKVAFVSKHKNNGLVIIAQTT